MGLQAANLLQSTADILTKFGGKFESALRVKPPKGLRGLDKTIGDQKCGP